MVIPVLPEIGQPFHPNREINGAGDWAYYDANGDGMGCGEGFLHGPTTSWIFQRRKNRLLAMNALNSASRFGIKK